MSQSKLNVVDDSRWDSHRAHVFSERPLLKNPFREEAWERLLLPRNLALSPREAAALSLVSGDSFAIVFAREHEFEGHHACRAALSSQALGTLADETPFGVGAVDVCGESETWGFVADPENFCLLGGTNEVIEGLTENLGGLTALQEAFAAAVLAGDVGFGEAAMRFLEDLVESIGWPRPNFVRARARGS